MTAQNVKLQTMNLLQKSNTVTSQRSTSKQSFENIMDHNLSLKGNKTDYKKEDKINNIQSNDKSDKDIYKQTKRLNKNDDGKFERVYKGKEKSSTENLVKSKDAIEESNSIDVDDMESVTEEGNILAQVMQFLQSLKNEIVEVLNITPEELDQLLTEQGNNILALLNTDTLNQLVLMKNNETNVAAFLTNENLVTTMNELMQTIDQSLLEANLPMSKEELKTLLDQLNEQNNQNIHPHDTLSEDKVMDTLELIPVHNSRETDNPELTINSKEEVKLEVWKTVSSAEKPADQSQFDDKKDSSSDASALEQYNVFLDNLSNVVPSSKVEFSGNLVQVTEFREIANQIIERIKVIIKPDQTSMELKLNPENLGRVNLSVQSKNGVMTAEFIVQNEVTKAAIESQIHNLRETLDQQGIKVESIEVTVASYAFEQNTPNGSDNQERNNENKSKKIISLEDINELDLMKEEQSSIANDNAGYEGSQINYTA